MHAHWRMGRTLGRTLYRDEQCVGIVDTPQIAEEIIASCNARSAPPAGCRCFYRWHGGVQQRFAAGSCPAFHVTEAAGHVDEASVTPFAKPTPTPDAASPFGIGAHVTHKGASGAVRDCCGEVVAVEGEKRRVRLDNGLEERTWEVENLRLLPPRRTAEEDEFLRRMSDVSGVSMRWVCGIVEAARAFDREGRMP